MMPVFKFLIRMLTLCTIAYLLVCAFLFEYQRSLIYYPQPSLMSTPTNTLNIPISEGQLQISVHQLNKTKALIYFGGNAEDVSRNLPEFAKNFPDYALYLMHYPSYGYSSGTPSEQAIFQNALTLFDKVYKKHQNITVLGRSLGTGAAVYLASQRPVSKLVLITPYESLEEVAAFHYPYLPVNFLLEDKFESWRYAAFIRIPILILAAEHDTVIPNTHAQRLYRHFNSDYVSYYMLANTNHGNISQNPQYLPLVQRFLKMPSHSVH